MVYRKSLGSEETMKGWCVCVCVCARFNVGSLKNCTEETII